MSGVTNMSGLFNADTSRKSVTPLTVAQMELAQTFNGDISGWNVSNVKNMSDMFMSSPNFDGDISGWDVSNVTNMEAMFSKSGSFNGDISGWNVSSVKNMSSMFFGNIIV